MTEFPAYALMDSDLMRQDVPGGQWKAVPRDQVKILLSALAGLTPELLEALTTGTEAADTSAEWNDHSIEELATRNLQKAIGHTVVALSASVPEPDPSGGYSALQDIVTTLGPLQIGWRAGGIFDVLANGNCVATHTPED